MLDIFLVGKSGETLLGDITDKWFEDRTKEFAKSLRGNNKLLEASTVSKKEFSFEIMEMVDEALKAAYLS